MTDLASSHRQAQRVCLPCLQEEIVDDTPLWLTNTQLNQSGPSGFRPMVSTSSGFRPMIAKRHCELTQIKRLNSTLDAKCIWCADHASIVPIEDVEHVLALCHCIAHLGHKSATHFEEAVLFTKHSSGSSSIQQILHGTRPTIAPRYEERSPRQS